MMPSGLNEPNTATEEPRGVFVPGKSPQRRPQPLPSTFTRTIDRVEPLPQTVRSKRIPIRMKRTTSEDQLYQDQAEAEARDYAMFLKVYEHLQEQRERTKDEELLHENAIFMDSLIQSRSKRMLQNQKQGYFGGRAAISSSPSGVDDRLDGSNFEEDSQGFEEIFDLDL